MAVETQGLINYCNKSYSALVGHRHLKFKETQRPWDTAEAVEEMKENVICIGLSALFPCLSNYINSVVLFAAAN